MNLFSEAWEVCATELFGEGRGRRPHLWIHRTSVKGLEVWQKDKKSERQTDKKYKKKHKKIQKT